MPLFQTKKDTEAIGKLPINGSCYGGGRTSLRSSSTSCGLSMLSILACVSSGFLSMMYFTRRLSALNVWEEIPQTGERREQREACVLMNMASNWSYTRRHKDSSLRDEVSSKCRPTEVTLHCHSLENRYASGYGSCRANGHDCKLLIPALQLLKAIFPSGIEVHICLDAGYAKLVEWLQHIRPGSCEKKADRKRSGRKSKRWIVVTPHSHMNQFRLMTTRYKKRAVSRYSPLPSCRCDDDHRTIFRMEFVCDSLWYNKEAQRYGRQKRTRDIDLTQYASVSETFLKQAAWRKLISGVQGLAA